MWVARVSLVLNLSLSFSSISESVLFSSNLSSTSFLDGFLFNRIECPMKIGSSGGFFNRTPKTRYFSFTSLRVLYWLPSSHTHRYTLLFSVSHSFYSFFSSLFYALLFFLFSCLCIRLYVCVRFFWWNTTTWTCVYVCALPEIMAHKRRRRRAAKYKVSYTVSLSLLR